MTTIRCFAIAFLTFAVFMPLIGCGGSASTSTGTSDVRQARLWAEENLKLKEEIEKLQSQIAEKKKGIGQYKDECSKEKQELQVQCEKEKQQMQKDMEETTSFLMEKVPTESLKEIEKLQKENEALKQQLQQLSPKK